QPALHALPEREEAGPQLVGDRPQAEVETGRLELPFADRRAGDDPAGLERGLQGLVREDAGAETVQRTLAAHGAPLSIALRRPSSARPAVKGAARRQARAGGRSRSRRSRTR